MIDPKNETPYDSRYSTGSQESLLKQFALAPFRGVEGLAQSVYGLSDFVAFDALPDWDERFLGRSEHWGPGLLEGITQFAIPFMGFSKLAGVTRLSPNPTMSVRAKNYARIMGAGAAADFVAFDPSEGRLSDLINMAPGLRNPVTEYLSTDMDDGELEGRLKNALEGLIVGPVFDGAISALGKGLKRTKHVINQRAKGRSDKNIAKDLTGREFNVDSDISKVFETMAGYRHKEWLVLHTLKNQMGLTDAQVLGDVGGAAFESAGGVKLFQSDARGFYSKTFAGLEGLSERMPLSQAKATIKSKAIEWEFTGLDDLLEANPNATVKDAKDHFIPIELEERIRTDTPLLSREEERRTLYNLDNEELAKRVADEHGVVPLLDNQLDVNTTLKELDQDHTGSAREYFIDGLMEASAREDEHWSPVGVRFGDQTPDHIENYRELTLRWKPEGGTGFTGGHFEDNTVFHVRFGDEMVGDKKILQVFEVQSDWSGRGHRAGYEAKKGEETILFPISDEGRRYKVKDLTVVESKETRSYPSGEAIPLWDVVLRSDGTVIDRGRSLTAALPTPEARLKTWLTQKAPYQKESGTPRHPMMKSWPEHAVQRMFKLAAEEGYDGIRFASDTEVKSIHGIDPGESTLYTHRIPKAAKVFAKKKGVARSKVYPAETDAHPYYFDNTSRSQTGKPDPLLQEVPSGIKGYAIPKGADKVIIGAFSASDVSTGVHEMAHAARILLFDESLPQANRLGISDEAIGTAAKESGASLDEGTGKWVWDTPSEEKFARSFERYLREGYAPSESTRGLMAIIASLMRNIYKRVTGSAIDVTVSKEMSGVFDDLMKRGDLPDLPDAPPGRGGEVGEPLAQKAEGDESLVGWKPERVDHLTGTSQKMDKVVKNSDGIWVPTNQFTETRKRMTTTRVAWVDPLAFVRATTLGGGEFGEIQSRSTRMFEDPSAIDYAGDFDLDKVRDAPYLNFTGYQKENVVSPETPHALVKIDGHEGRHRMAALARKGVKRVPVLLSHGGGNYQVHRPGVLGDIKVLGQFDEANESLVLHDVMDLVPENEAAINAKMREAGMLFQKAEGDTRYPTPAEDPDVAVNMNHVADFAELRAFVHKKLAGFRGKMVREGVPIEEQRQRYAAEYERVMEELGVDPTDADLVAILRSNSEAVEEAALKVGASRMILRDFSKNFKEWVDSKMDVDGAFQGDEFALVEALRRKQLLFEVAEQVRIQMSEIARTLGSFGHEAVGGSGLPKMTKAGAKAGEEVVVTKLIPATKDIGEARAILDAHGGAKKVLKRIQQDFVYLDMNPGATVPKTRSMGWLAATQEYWMNNILSGIPLTHAANMTSGFLRGLIRPLERAAGAMMTGDFKLAKDELRELRFFVAEGNDALKIAAYAARSGDPKLVGYRGGIQEHKIEVNAISTAGIGQKYGMPVRGGKGTTTAGKALDHVGGFVNLPSRLLMAEDEFFKQIAYRSRLRRRIIEIADKRYADPTENAEFVERMMRGMGDDGQMYSQSTLQMRAEKLAKARGLEGNDLKKFVQDEVNTQWDTDVAASAIEARDVARDSTFTKDLSRDVSAGGMTTKITGGMGVRGTVNHLSASLASITGQAPMLKFIFPFIRTPTNILQFFLDRSVGALSDGMRAMTDDVFRKAMTREQRADLAGRMAVGGTLFGSMYALATNKDENGLPVLTGAGPSDPRERKLWQSYGWQPYSVRIEDKYFSYRRLDPFSIFAGLMADMAQEGAAADLLNRRPEFGKALMIALTNNLASKTYLTGALNMARMLNSPEQEWQYIRNTFASGFAPMSGFTAQAINPNMGEDYLLELRSVWDAMLAKTPGGFKGIPIKRDVLGDPIEKAKAAPTPFLGPTPYTNVKNDRLHRELILTGAGISPPRAVNGGVDWTEFGYSGGGTAYDRWTELHGKVKINGKTLKQQLERTIRSKGYQLLSQLGFNELDSPRVAVLRRWVGFYRAKAKVQVMREMPELAEAMSAVKYNTQALKRGGNINELIQ